MKYGLIVALFVVLAAIAAHLKTSHNTPEPAKDVRLFCNEFPPLYNGDILVETYSPTGLVQAIRRLMDDTVTAGQREGLQMAEQLANESPRALADDIQIFGSALTTLTPAPARGQPETDPALTSDYVQASMRKISGWLVVNCPPRDGWPNL